MARFLGQHPIRVGPCLIPICMFPSSSLPLCTDHRRDGSIFVLGGWVTKAERDHAELDYAAPYSRRSLERPLTRQSVSQDHNHMALRKGTAAPCPLCV